MTEAVVITGASGGIGRATARLFGERGANVGLIARGEEGLAGAVRDVEEAGGKPLPLPADVADSGPGALTLTRVLGARHLLQAMATAWARESGLPSGPVLLAGAAVDATHAASMLGLAVISRPLRRAELADAMLEVGLGALGVVAMARLRTHPGGSV
jgi:NAD(P)-dependent dehydrogenase (short-subunit alcohol dehydrogenase family)